MLLLCAAALPLLLWAAPPPSVQFAADCAAPIYASDVLVCNDPELLELDRRLAVLIAEPARADAGVASRESSEEAHWDWFRRSRMSAFKSDHRACLLSAYRGRIAVLDKNLAAN